MFRKVIPGKKSIAIVKKAKRINRGVEELLSKMHYFQKNYYLKSKLLLSFNLEDTRKVW